MSRGPFNSSRTGQNLSTSGYGLLDYKKHNALLKGSKRKYEDMQDPHSGQIAARMPLFKFASDTIKEDKDKIWASFTVIEKENTLRAARKKVQFVGFADNETDVFAHFAKELTAIVSGAITIPNFSEENMYPGQLLTALPPPVDDGEFKKYLTRLSSQNNIYRDVIPGYIAPLKPIGASGILVEAFSTFANTSNGLYLSKEKTIKSLIPNENPSSKLERHEEVALRFEHLYRSIVAFHLTYNSTVPVKTQTLINTAEPYAQGYGAAIASDVVEKRIRTEIKSFMDLGIDPQELNKVADKTSNYHNFFADGIFNAAFMMSIVLFEDTSRVIGRCIKTGLSGTTDQAHAIVY